MHVCVHACACTCMRESVCVFMCVYVCVSIFVCAYLRVFIVCVHLILLSRRVHICMHSCMRLF